MAEAKQPPKEQQIPRIFEQPPDAISFYCEMGQVIGTKNEIIVQFYDSIPGPPDSSGRPMNLRTRLRATITLSPPHARNIGKSLMEKVEEPK